MQNITKRLGVVAAAVVFILLIPLTLQLTIGTGVDGQGFNWKLNDFVIMGTLLFGIGLALDLTVRKLTDSANRVIVAAAIVLIFLLIWAELAVGVFGTPFAGS